MAAAGGMRDQRAHELAHGPAELERTAHGVGLPEGHLPRFARGRRDQHAVVADLFDAPARRAEEERLADAALEHHLLVELADASAGAVLAGEEDAVQSAIGNRPAVGHGDPARALTRGDHVLEPVPRQPRPQVGEVVRRIASRQHVEHALERAAGELGKRRGAAHGVEQAIDRPLIERHHRDDLLRQDVERVARIPRALDLRLVHRARDGRARDQVAAKLGHDDAAARLADRVARPADALHAARDRGRRLDLDDEIDRAHVDAELERRGGHEAAQQAGLEPVLDLDPLRARDRAVVRAHEHLAGELVDARSPGARRCGGCSRRSGSSDGRG